MEQVAVIKFDPAQKKYVASVNGNVVGKSGSAQYLKDGILGGRYVNKGVNGVTNVQVFGAGGKVIQLADPGTEIPSKKRGLQEAMDAPEPVVSKFDINERFGFMTELINMVITRKTNSIIICGPGGLGKTYGVLDALKAKGKRPTTWMDPADVNDSEIGLDDSADEIENKILGSMQKPGDYTVIKGFSTPKSLYRTLYENRNKIVVFDDCDSVLRDPVGVNLLKAALDSYDERWVSWRTEGPASDDLPEVFKFNGSVIFISNLPQYKIDQAIRTRAFVIDLSMSVDQRIERMKNVLPNILPEYDMSLKQEALDLMCQFKDVSKELNFRTLINVIKIRVGSNASKWKSLAEYSLTCM